jgi:hypothetical protein
MHTAAHRSAAAAGLLAPAPAVIAAPALSGPALAASAASHPSIAGPAAGPTTQGIIMKDGQICDPIRHMGC